MITRREAIALAGCAVAGALLGRPAAANAAVGGGDGTPTLRLALLHMSSVPGDLVANRAVIDLGLRIAARHGANVLLTPELALPGYDFRKVIGLDWISHMPDPWLRAFGRRASQLGVTPIIGTPERDRSGRLRNAMLVLGPDGDVTGRHWKIDVIPGAAEGWAVPGERAIPVDVCGVSAGLLICADSYQSGPASEAARRGARVLLSSAAWMPGPMGPQGVWEKRSLETGLPLLVANRTSPDVDSGVSRSRSVGVYAGERTFAFHTSASHVLIVDLIGPRLEPRLRRAVAMP